MSDYTEADLAPERQLQHIANLQRQVNTLFEIHVRQARETSERIEKIEVALDEALKQEVYV